MLFCWIFLFRSYVTQICSAGNSKLAPQTQAKKTLLSMTLRVRQFRLHFVFLYEAKSETLTFSPVSNENEYERRTLMAITG
jgi:hypothetical protein